MMDMENLLNPSLNLFALINKYPENGATIKANSNFLKSHKNNSPNMPDIERML
jgi:hypothetical protein